MNVFEKLTAARLYFMNAGAKKSGRNEFAKYDYFELADILPIVNRAAKEIGFCCVVSFGQEEATLEFINSEKPDEKIIFRSPMSTADLKNNHAVQNLGAVETYIRRYLYLVAFEVVEGDALDVLIPSDRSTPPAPAKSIGKKADEQKSAEAPPLIPPEQAAENPGAEMKRILEEERRPTGEALFTETDKKHYRELVRTRGYAVALSTLQNDLLARRDKLRGSAPQAKFDRLLESTRRDGTAVYSEESKAYWRAVSKKNGLGTALRMLENDWAIKRNL